MAVVGEEVVGFCSVLCTVPQLLNCLMNSSLVQFGAADENRVAQAAHETGMRPSCIHRGCVYDAAVIHKHVLVPQDCMQSRKATHIHQDMHGS